MDEILKHADDVSFSYDFTLEGKAINEVEDDGDLIIEGWAAQFEGLDRQNEQFAEGAFQRGIKAFLENGGSLCFHHKHEKVLGKVLELEEVEGKGLRMKARVDGAIKTHPELGTLYQQIKNGTLSGLSVGGFFKRAYTNHGPRIVDMDFTEVSVTGVPVDPHKPAFSVVAGKALNDMPHPIEGEESPAEWTAEELEKLGVSLDKLQLVLGEKAVPSSPKGDWPDREALALILAFEQLTNEMPQRSEYEEGDTDGDPRVDELIGNVKSALDEYAKEAHSLAAKLGPLPKVTFEGHMP
jgi:HK97 family phage prohead protease